MLKTKSDHDHEPDFQSQLINSYIDTYFVVFFPMAIGKDDNWVIQSSGISASIIAKQNPAFDVNKDGQVQVWEVKKVMLDKLPSQWLNNASFSLVVKSHPIYVALASLSVIGIISYFLYRKLKK